MGSIINLIRVRQWIKNLLVFAPLAFALDFNGKAFALELIAFSAFCFASSAVYIINDIIDIKSDRVHKTKRLRPIAAGKISIHQALILELVLLIFAFYAAQELASQLTLILGTYYILNLAYSLWLKKYLILDIMIIAFGFILRILAGAYAISVDISNWILVVTFFAALFLALGKRKNEVELLEADSQNHRQVLAGYTPDFLNQLLSITAGITIVGYTLYTIDTETTAHFGTDKLLYTIPFVVFGIFRYFHLIYNKDRGGDPTNIFLTDKPLIIDIIIWIGVFIFIALKL